MRLSKLILLVFLSSSFCKHALAQNDSVKVFGQFLKTGQKLYSYSDDSTLINKFIYLGDSTLSVNQLKRDSLKLIQHLRVMPGGEVMADGLAIEYRNGYLHEMYYREGVSREREYYQFYTSGKIKVQSHFEDDCESGEYLEYYESGVISKKGYMTNGVPSGKWTFFYESGNPRTIGYYSVIRSDERITAHSEAVDRWGKGLSVKDGQWNYYSKEGLLIKMENFDKGELIE